MLMYMGDLYKEGVVAPQIMILPKRIQTNILNIFKVPEPPKKIVPEKKAPAPAPKKVPPTKGILGPTLPLGDTSFPVLMHSSDLYHIGKKVTVHRFGTLCTTFDHIA